ncbi:hypothetical protein M3Y98_00856200 [Aphelenchoides besseyi]|nr:hypothetical protein M3Y98_00856200 [Aphelenchoides besseyi]KAI6211132.1 hypothetical protein M3Y96_00401200 [Aphelenchoides besseyi]
MDSKVGTEVEAPSSSTSIPADIKTDENSTTIIKESEKNRIDNADIKNEETAMDVDLRPIQNWTHAELNTLLNLCEDQRYDWNWRVKMLNNEYGKNHPTGFFTIENCKEKFSRLTGESGGQLASKEMMAWIKLFLKKSGNERHAHGDAARSARLRRYFELMSHSINGQLTDDQTAELAGVDEYYGIVNCMGKTPESEDKDELLSADLFCSKLSIDEWKSFQNPDDIVQKLRSGKVDKSRLFFKHPIQEPEIIERIVIDEEDDRPHISTLQHKSATSSRVVETEEKTAHEKPTTGEVIKRKRGRPRIYPIEEKRPVTSKAVAPTVVRIQEPPQTSSHDQSPDVTIYDPNVVISSPSTVATQSSPLRSPIAQILPTTLAPQQPPSGHVVLDEAMEAEEPETVATAIIEVSDKTSSAVESKVETLSEVVPIKTPTPPKRGRRPKPKPIKDEKADEETTVEKSAQEATMIQDVKTEDSSEIVFVNNAMDVDMPKPTKVDQCTQTELTVYKKRAPKPNSTPQSVSGIRTRRSAPLLSTEKTIDIGSNPQSPTPSATSQRIEMRLRECQTDTVTAEMLEDSIIVYGYIENQASLAENYVNNQTNRSGIESTSSAAANSASSSSGGIAQTKPKRRSTMTEKQKAAEKEKEMKTESTSTQQQRNLIPVIVDENLLNEILPHVQWITPEEPEETNVETTITPQPTVGRRGRLKRAAAEATKANASTSRAKHANTTAVRSTPANTSTTPQPTQIIVPTFGTPAPPKYVSPKEKSLFLAAHNLIVNHNKASEFQEPVTDDMVSDYSTVVKNSTDLSTIRKLIDENKISTLSELNDYYSLMCMNAMMFNDDSHTVNSDARELQQYCSQTIQNMKHGPTRKAARRANTRSYSTSTRSASAARPNLRAQASEPRSDIVRKIYSHISDYPSVRCVKNN